MSAQEFKPGAEVWARVDRWPAAQEWPDDTSRVHLVCDEDGFWSATADDPAAPLCIPPSCAEYIHPLPEFVTEPSVDNSEDLTEPEDADDVEPEPLKEGDWCLVWGQVDKVESPAGSFVSIGRSGERRYFAANAIVRPDAGQVPPWVKLARCTSLYDSGAGSSLMRCEGEAGHQTMHVVGWVAWADAEEYGRVEISS